MKQIPPLILREKYFSKIEKEIISAIRKLIHWPLLLVLAEEHPEYHNAVSSLAGAIQSGSVWYDDGSFRGQFNAMLSRELRALGAVYNARSGIWTLDSSSVPANLKMVQAHADSRYDALRRGLIKTLDGINVDSITEHLRSKESYGKAIEWMNDDFEKTLKNITIAPKLTGHMRDRIADEWGQNLDLYIKDWASKNIIKLRETIQTEAFTGRRSESLENIILQNYSVSRHKAKFLARQETSLLLSKFRETRYAEVGVKRYRWSTSHDERVRSDHRHLNSKVFDFSDPPITDTKTGARNNPGEDFGCRCLAIALVE